MTIEVPQTLEYKGGQLSSAPLLEVENFTNWKKRFIYHIVSIEPQFKNIIKNGPYIRMATGQRKLEVQWTADERKAANLDQRLKSHIMFVLPDDQMNSVINCLITKSTWDDLILYHEGTSDVKESRIMDLRLCYNTFKFKECETLTHTFTRYKALMNELVNDGINLSKLEINIGFINGLPKKWLNSIYETQKEKSLMFVKPLSTGFFSTSIVQDFQDSPDNEEDTRSSHEYQNDLEEEYQARVVLAKSKIFFKKGTQSSSMHKSELRPTKDFEAKYNKVKAKLALLSSSASPSKSIMVKNKVKVLMALAKDNDAVNKEGAANLDFLTMHHVNTEILKENQNLRKELKELTAITKTWLNSSNKVNQCISEQILTQKKRILGVDQLTEDPSSFGQKDLVFVKSLANDTKVFKPGVEISWLSEAEGFILPNLDTDRIPPPESQTNTIKPPVAVTISSATDYDLADESLVCSTPLPPLEKLGGDEPISGPKANKSILKSNSTFKMEALKMKPIWYLDSGCSRHMTGVKSYLHKYVEQPGPKVVFRDDSTYVIEGYGSIKCNGIVFTKVTFVNGLKYNLISISQLCDAKYIVQFDEKRGTIFNSNKEIVMIAPRVRDVYVLDMTSSEPESCFFAKANENLNWLWHKRLAHLNFKTINQLAKQNLVMGLPSLVYSKDKPCSSCENGKHHRASFKTKQTFYIKKCLHLLHIDLFGPVTLRSINHEKYTLVIIDEYSRKNKTLIEAARIMLSGSVFSKQYWNEAVATACYTQNRSTVVKRHLKTPYEIFHGRIPSIDFLHVFGCPVYIHKHKDYIGKFHEKADDGYFLGYSVVSKAFRVFNIRKQQTEETYHIIFDESTDAIKFLKPSVDNINIAESERYPADEYIHHYEPSQYDQNDQPAQENDFPNDNPLEHSNYNNDSPIIENLINAEVVQDSEPTSSPVEDTSAQNTIRIPNISSSIPSTISPVAQDKWSQNKHIELVNIIDSISEGELKKVSEALKHHGWVDAMQDELN
ncbi:retrovirus-related pol polyprotein from transposon TNT 1-94 [Tanacetum coccineum]|uniref:Retrovirus-related pol polyprotein from transposon TNT 1-94 n=1 Tax=Tanacetum coccineum TaxID=301880 RepID=A0ABQ5G4M0_9ASTR